MKKLKVYRKTRLCKTNNVFMKFDTEIDMTCSIFLHTE
jgi:hypothetical protein